MPSESNEQGIEMTTPPPGAPEREPGPASASEQVSWSGLVERIQRGEPEALEELYHVFSKGVRFVLCRHLGPQDLDDRLHDVFLIVTQSIRKGELREPERLMGFVRTVNGYVTEREPWKLAKDPANTDALDDVLYSTADALRAVAVLLNAFLPKACHLLWKSLGAPGELADARIATVTTDHLPAGATVRKGPILFPRLDS